MNAPAAAPTGPAPLAGSNIQPPGCPTHIEFQVSANPRVRAGMRYPPPNHNKVFGPPTPQRGTLPNGRDGHFPDIRGMPPMLSNGVRMTADEWSRKFNAADSLIFTQWGQQRPIGNPVERDRGHTRNLAIEILIIQGRIDPNFDDHEI